MENSPIAEQLIALKIHRDAKKASIERREKTPSHGAPVLALERAELAEIEARIKELEPEKGKAGKGKIDHQRSNRSGNRKNRKKQMQPIIRTNNKPHAFALAVAGATFDCPTADDRSKDGPAINTYSSGFLRQPRIQKIIREKFGSANVRMEDAIRELIARRVPGDVVYIFSRTPVAEEATQAWDAMHAEFIAAEKEGRPPSMPNISPAVVAQVLFIATNSEKEFREIPFLNPMRQMASTVGSITRDEPIRDRDGTNRPAPMRVTEGDGKVWSINGSPEMKAKLGV